MMGRLTTEYSITSHPARNGGEEEITGRRSNRHFPLGINDEFSSMDHGTEAKSARLQHDESEKTITL